MTLNLKARVMIFKFCFHKLTLQLIKFNILTHDCIPPPALCMIL